MAAAAALLVLAAGRATGAPADPLLPALAFTGTLGIYTLDRLRDLPRDRRTAPRRAEFVAARRRVLVAVSGLSVAAAAALALAAGPAVAALSGLVAVPAFWHRRLKRSTAGSAFYVSSAWLVVAAGLPAIRGGDPARLPAAALALAGALLGNALASGLRDGDGPGARLGPRRTLGLARGAAAASLAAALALPAARCLVPVPALTLLALVGFRPGELYGLVVLDGALALGALLSLALPTS